MSVQRFNVAVLQGFVLGIGVLWGTGAHAALTCAPPESTINITQGLDWLTESDVLDRTAPANLVANGDFSEVTAREAGASLDSDLVWAFGANAVPNEIDSFATWLTDGNYRNGVQLVSVPEWTITGGGQKTYAFVSTATDYDGEIVLPNFGATEPLMAGASANLMYFGNSVFWGATPAMTFEIEGEVSRTDYTITNSRFTAEELGDGDSPVKITQTINTTPGKTYRLQFVQLTEGGTTDPLEPGAFGVEITGYGRSYLRVNEAGRRLTLDFVATADQTELGFLQYGHFSYDNGYSSEFALDDVIVNEVDGICGSGGSGGGGQGGAISVDATSTWALWLMVLVLMGGAGIVLVGRGRV